MEKSMQGPKLARTKTVKADSMPVPGARVPDPYENRSRKAVPLLSNPLSKAWLQKWPLLITIIVNAIILFITLTVLVWWPVIVKNTVRGGLGKVEWHLRHRRLTDVLNLDRKPDFNALDLKVITVGDDGFDISMRNLRQGPSFISIEPFNLSIQDNTYEQQIVRISIPHTKADADMITFGVRFDPGNIDAMINMIETAAHAKARPKVAIFGEATVKLLTRKARVKIQRSNLPTPMMPDFAKFERFISSPVLLQKPNGNKVLANASIDIALPYTMRVWIGEIGGFIFHHGKELAEGQIDKFALHPGRTTLKASGRADLAMLQTDQELKDITNSSATSSLSLTLRGRTRPTNPTWLNEFLGREQNITISREMINLGVRLAEEVL